MDDKYGDEKKPEETVPPSSAHRDGDVERQGGMSKDEGIIAATGRAADAETSSADISIDETDLVSGDAEEERQDAADQEREKNAPSRAPGGGIAGVLERVVSRASTKSSWNPGPPPDGGLKAWTAGE